MKNKVSYTVSDCIKLRRVIQSSDTFWRGHAAIYEDLLVRLREIIKERMVTSEEIELLILDCIKEHNDADIYNNVKIFICECPLDTAPLMINDGTLRPWARWRLMIRK